MTDKFRKGKRTPFQKLSGKRGRENFSADVFAHNPVLLSEILAMAQKREPKNVLDCTFGRGGHSKALLSQHPELRILALDWDEEAINYGKELAQASRIQFLRTSFYHFPENIGSSPSFLSEWRAFDMILMDLGVSSPQLDQGGRGFSFHKDGPLDMRMDQRGEITAEDLVNGLSKKELVQLFREYGEVKHPFSVVQAIFEERKKKRITTTGELARLIQKTARPGRPGRHPATPYFLALRIKVNGELEGLKISLPSFLPFLNSTGYFIVISFHSLEDRIVKHLFREFVREGKGSLWNKKAIMPSTEERLFNIRSRSAKLRVFVKS
ncbi:MAG: 16S rRNA (cytosine(1402)-N(4))-methyltransferase RsmH [Bdellovibrionales bacterium]|nr:16S rRNA (cytosine(1402)-N(4))-methyltransferase RsmH [Bdellovibrionales bacterium]